MRVKLILASKSPARRRILEGLGIPIEAVDPGEVEEGCGEPCRVALENARRKALKVAEGFDEGLIIGADTLISHGGGIIGKSRSRGEVAETLRLLRGSSHRVITGLVVLDAASGRMEEGVEETVVYMRELSDDEIDLYASIGESVGRAGGYAIQGLGALLVDRIEGCYYNVVGLPLRLLDELLRRFGVSLLEVAANYRGL
ncbi:septum formation protein Maf [Candidatus Bathyarchaeota archaeon]|nr:MAG: septum formation protein Maf [Candidatus Bathyarchaeota archaeon]RLI15919.1 MAG: septum formation protein Maf [Candidatus Bathyarchaeota archaeon]